MRILTRYVLVEIAKSFSLALSVLVGFVLIVTSYQVLHKFNLLQFGFLLQILPSLVVGSLSLTMPFALLVAATLTLGRLSADNEITALKACGVHLGRVLAPIVGLSLVLSGVTYYLTDVVVPASFVDPAKQLNRAVKSLVQSQLSASSTSINFFEGYRISYTGIEGGRFRGLVIHRLDGTRVAEEILADEAEISYDERNQRVRFRLMHGSVAHTNKDEQPWDPDERTVSFDEAEIDFEIPRDEDRPDFQPKPRSLTSQQILEYIRHRERQIAGLRAHLDQTGRQIASTGLTPALEESQLKDRHDLEEREAWWHELRTAYHQRIASSLLCLLIVLVGAPMGILVRHANKLIAFGVSTVPVFVVYFPLFIVGRELGDRGALPPVVAAWLANVALLVVAAVLLWRALRR